MMFNPMPSPLTILWMPYMLPWVIWAEVVQGMSGQKYAVQEHFEAKRRRIPQGYTPDIG